MKKLLLLMLLSLLFFTSCELFTEEPIQGDVYYINVGIDYDNNGTSDEAKKDDLHGTINDARELHKALSYIIARADRNGIGYLMLQEGPGVAGDDTYPSKTNIIKMLENLADPTQKENLLIFTFSGHGAKDTGSLLFATTTADTFNPSDFMSATELLELLAAIPGKKIVLLDSCFSGTFVDESPSSTNTILNNSLIKFFETYNSSDEYGVPELFVLSSSAHTNSYESNFGTKDDEHWHGIFTYALLEALGWGHPHATDVGTVTLGNPPVAKNGRITVDGLFKYIKKNQSISSRLKLFGSWTKFQHPMTTGGPLDMVLFKNVKQL